jgi:hypothetical protein
MALDYDEPEVVKAFRTWFTDNGGSFHPDVRYAPGKSFFTAQSNNKMYTRYSGHWLQHNYDKWASC